MNKFTRVGDSTVMPWGKHKGKEVADVPASYLIWLEGEWRKRGIKPNAFTNGLMVYINENRQVIEKQAREKRYFCILAQNR